MLLVLSCRLPLLLEAAPSDYQSAALANGPYAYYRLGEASGAGAADTSGNGWGGTYFNAPTLGVAGFGTGDTAVTFNGTSQYVSSSATNFGVGMTNFSVEFIFKTTTTSRRNLAGTLNTGATTGFEVSVNADAGGATATGSIRLFLRDDSNNTVGCAFVNSTAFDGNYHHLVFTYDSIGGASRIKAYLDGVAQSVSYGAVAGTGAPASFSSFSFNPVFGARNNRATIDNYFPGTLDEVALYSTTLSAEDVLNHYQSLPPPVGGTFGVTDYGSQFVVDTGGGLVFKVNKNNGTILSWVFKGVEFNGPSGKGSHLISGLGSATVTATNTGNIIKVTLQTDATNGVVANLTHYFIVTNGVNNVYLATYQTEETDVGELRWITRLKGNVLVNGPAPSDLTGATGTIESGDVFGSTNNGTTYSKYYGDGVTHGKERALDLTYCGATGTGVGVWMVFGNRESSSGGPFFRDIENQYSTTSTADQEIYNYMNSGHTQTETRRTQNVLHGPYVLIWNNGAAPTLPIDTSWLGALGLTGWADASGRGAVSGTAAGVLPGIQGVVGLANSSESVFWRMAYPALFGCVPSRNRVSSWVPSGFSSGAYVLTRCTLV
jgi:hypothetical protein